jgi:hypothetical protein
MFVFILHIEAIYNLVMNGGCPRKLGTNINNSVRFSVILIFSSRMFDMSLLYLKFSGIYP